MKTLKATRPLSKLALLAPLALSGIALAPHAWADNILLAQSTLVAGTESTVDSFTTSTTGTVTIDVQALDWPAPLSALSFSATTGSSLLSSWYWSGQGASSDVMTFTVGPGTYYAHIMASADANNPKSMDLGLYSMLVTFTPSVPLPASGWLLLTGMLALAGLARVARPRELTGTAAA